MVLLVNSVTVYCYRYRLALLKPCQKAVNQSAKISIRMDGRGFLSLQCMILTTDKQICFVEYMVICILCAIPVFLHQRLINGSIVSSPFQCVPDEDSGDEG